MEKKHQNSIQIVYLHLFENNQKQQKNTENPIFTIFMLSFLLEIFPVGNEFISHKIANQMKLFHSVNSYWSICLNQGFQIGHIFRTVL